MTIVAIDVFKRKAAAKRGFAAWKKRFGLGFNEHTGFGDLPDPILLTLARPGQQATAALWELIMGALELGACEAFEDLPPADRVAVVDTQLFLADQARFEMMARLGWILDYPGAGTGLIDMVLGFGKPKAPAADHGLQLADAHPEYPAYVKLTPRDREMAIRRLLPLALEAFRLRLET